MSDVNIVMGSRKNENSSAWSTKFKAAAFRAAALFIFDAAVAAVAACVGVAYAAQRIVNPAAVAKEADSTKETSQKEQESENT